jgi:hypothetical protein
MINRHKIKVEIIIDEDAYVDYVDEQVQKFVYNNPYITSASIRYCDEEITEREKFVSSRGYQESIIDNPYFKEGNAASLNKEFKLLQGKEVTDIYGESKSYGKLLDIVADRDDFYYVTEKCWVSCVIGLKEYKQ